MAAVRLENITTGFLNRDYLQTSFGKLPLKAIFRAAKNIELDTHLQEEVADAEPGKPARVLDDLNLTVPDGKTFVVVGPSGCGKSTLLRVIAGLQEYGGRVYYDEEDVSPVDPGDRYIGMVFQNYALYPHFKSRDNLGFFFKMHQTADSEAEERIRVTSEIMGIGFKELLKRKPGTLSGGEQQRVAIARAIVRRPRVFLFDEPLSNLDAKLRVKTRTEIKRLLTKFGITAVYVTHDQTEAAALADKIAVMHKGKIEQVATYGELLNRPANMFVADFIGSPPMNIFRNGIIKNGRLEISAEFAVPLPIPIKKNRKDGQKLGLGIRPAEISPADTGQSSNLIRIKGTVMVIEPDFAMRIQTLHVKGRETEFKAVGPASLPVKRGQEMEFAFKAESCYYFNTEDKKLIYPID